MKMPPLFYTCLFLIFGILINEFFSSNYLWVVIGIVSLAIIFFRVEKKYPKIFFLIFILLLAGGFMRSELFFKDLEKAENQFGNLYGKNIVLSGVVDNIPEKKASSQKVILNKLKMAFSGKEEYLISQPGKVLIKTTKFRNYEYGQILEITGLIEEPQDFDDFDYREYLRQDWIFGILTNPQIQVVGVDPRKQIIRNLFLLKNTIQEKTNRFFPEPQAALLNGMLLGIKSGFDDDFSNNLRQTGLTHIVVVSGTNISILLLLMMSFVSIIGRRKTIFLSLAVIFIYIILVGFNPPALRALIMGGLVLAACLLGRKSAAVITLFVSGGVMVFLNPMLFKSLSFQLSFLTTLGILLFYQQVNRLLFFVPHLIRENLAITLSAQILIWPLIAQTFSEISVISPLTNALVLPSVFPITLLGIVYVFLSFIFSFSARIIGFVLLLLLDYFVTCVNFFGKFSFASIVLDIRSGTFYLIYYLLILLFYIYIRHKRKDELVADF